jgi:hypothetical protein
LPAIHDEQFTVFIRHVPIGANSMLDAGEHPVAFCSTYSEARHVRETLMHSGVGACVIRFEGATGGGD